MAAMVEKHLVQPFMSITRAWHGCLVWQHDSSASTCQVSGPDIDIFLANIFLNSLGGAEPKPGRPARLADRPESPQPGSIARDLAEISETAAGHTVRAPELVGPTQPLEAMEEVGSKAPEPERGERKERAHGVPATQAICATA